MLRIHGLVYGRDAAFVVDIDPNERVPALWDACEKKLVDYIGEDDLEVVRAWQRSTNGWLQTDSPLIERLTGSEFDALAEMVKDGAGRMNRRSTLKELGFPEISRSKKEDVHVVAIVVDWEDRSKDKAPTDTMPATAAVARPESSSIMQWRDRFGVILSGLLPGRSRLHEKKE